MTSHSKFSDAKGANDAKLSICESAPLPAGPVNVEYQPESSLHQPPRGKKRKRGRKTHRAMITEENKSYGDEITSLKSKSDDLLGKTIKRIKIDLGKVKCLINRQTDMIDMLWNELVTCQKCNEGNHTAAECPQS